MKWKKPYNKIPEVERMNLIERACKQVSRGVFYLPGRRANCFTHWPTQKHL
jgi:hypothetical protein